MCSYLTQKTPVTGSAKGATGWFHVNAACVYLDHPYFSAMDHALTIDFIDETAGPQARVAVELSRDSARELVRCIEAALANELPQG